MTDESTYDARPVYDDDETPSTAGVTPVAQRMQSLLSRAVEEQVTEQRHLAEVLDAFRFELGELRGQLRSRDAFDEIRSEVDAVRDRVDTTAGRVMELTQRLEAVHNAVDRLVQQRTERSPELDRLDELADRFDSIPQPNLDPLMARVDRIEARLSEMSGPDFDPLHERLDSIESRLSDLPEPDFSPLHDRLVALGTRLDELSAPDIDSLHERLARLEARLSDIDVPDLEPIHERLARLDEYIGGLSGEAMPAAELLQAERRIATHIDEAVLALAEALLRPRPAAPAAPTSDLLDLPARPEFDEPPLPQLSAPPGPPDSPPPSRVVDEPPGDTPAIRVDEHAEPRRRPWWRPGG